MHFVAERAALAGALAAAAKIAERNSPSLMVNQVLVECQGDQVAVTATNYDSELRLTIPAQGRADGAACLPAHKLTDIIKAAPEGAQVEIAQAGDAAATGIEAGKYTIRFGRSRFVLSAIQASEFPSFRLADGAGDAFTLSAAALLRLLSATSPFMLLKDSSHYVLGGVYLHRVEEELIAVGCDRHRVARAGIPAPEGAAGPVLDGAGIVIPDSSVRLLLSMPAGDVAIRVTANLMEASWPGAMLTTKLLDGAYPDYRQFFSLGANHDVTVTADAKTIRQAAARVALATSDKVGRLVKLSVDAAGAITFSTAGENGESGTEEMAGETTAPIAVGFNVKYLSDAMAVCGDDRITLSLKSTEDGAPTMSPCYISPAGDAAVRLLVMPMLTN